MPTVDSLLKTVREIEPIIRQYAQAAERERKLAIPVAKAMQEAGLYRLWRPKAFGGLEVEPISAFRVIEEVSRIDSAAGWNLQIAVAHDMFAPWFGDQAAQEIFGFEAIPVGSFNPARKAVPVAGGYRISGRTTFVSGAHHATAFLGFANIYDDGELRVAADGNPEMLLIAVPAPEAEIVDNWNTMGMRGSGSHDVEMRDVFIPEHWAAPWRPLEKPGSAYQGSLYRLTVWPAIAALVPPALGIARAAIDEAVELITRKTPAYGTKTLKNQAVVQSQLARAEAKLGAGRLYFYQAFEEAWKEAVAARSVTIELKAKMQLAMTHAVLESAAAVDLIHEIVGASGIREEYEFSKHFRDIHVITQHGFINAGKLEAVGQIMLGLEPEWPFFQF
ncbi:MULTISPECIES: acyl-CoA dehydrogenase family protein [unclassified Methylocaldum]|uniref:acyl-CoA dehydrogenase family protein n=1 Tax=unclassified Methylocaldum TaxID=2622260 RepID=UPI00098B5844|nr:MULTISPECIES: acyl-CoA dehydrogenase family protein [unclassified Methylocaldum]MBP1149672.1 alkylation response protein AidB-like acyl-CoA dehydrogenase [Methylocaldum sp. RMAD-M]